MQIAFSDLQSSSILIYNFFLCTSVYSIFEVIRLHLESTCYLTLSFQLFEIFSNISVQVGLSVS